MSRRTFLSTWLLRSIGHEFMARCHMHDVEKDMCLKCLVTYTLAHSGDSRRSCKASMEEPSAPSFLLASAVTLEASCPPDGYFTLRSCRPRAGDRLPQGKCGNAASQVLRCEKAWLQDAALR